MGNSITKSPCFSGDPYAAVVASDPATDDSLGHSFTYLPMAAAFDRTTTAGAMSSETSFFSLSGAAISANLATSASIPSFRLLNEQTWPPMSGGTFESSRSFTAVPLQAASPRLSMSGPLLSMSGRLSETSGNTSTASDRFSDRPFMSGTLDSSLSSSSFAGQHQPSVSRLIAERRARRRNERSLFQYLVSAASRLRFGAPRSGFWPVQPTTEMESLSEGDYRSPNGNVQWAQGVVGEDRFHVAVSEEHGWVFVGIYDGFSGPDAADYLFSNLYVAVHRELKGVLWDDIQVGQPADSLCSVDDVAVNDGSSAEVVEREPKKGRTGNADANASSSTSFAGTAMAMHRSVLQALARALRKTEDTFFEAAAENFEENPEVALMGSCVLVMLMKGTDVYVMNVGDSRAVLATRREPDLENVLGKASQDLKQFKQEIMRELQAQDRDGLQSVQLTPEHSTAVEEEVRRIRSQHLNDRYAIDEGRVKGKLNVTRAFGAGFLKDPKWNTSMFGPFQFNYVGKDPYITCIPSLCHHRIGTNDKFLVLSSDGLYQYFTNKEVVDQVAMFTAEHPEGDPAHHLVGELVHRAARKHGMDYRTLLGIPRGNRRVYHDDVSVIVISFEGRIWRSSV